jgi:PIN domain nuclease of toxin-antitoxin system
MILLDTHALIWLIEGDDQLGDKAVHLIDRERAEDGAMIAAISLWETAMLIDKDRVSLSRSLPQWFDLVLSSPGFHLVPISPLIGADAGTLPGSIHGDPADRLIIATARALGCAVATVDQRILDYAASGQVRAIDARR